MDMFKSYGDIRKPRKITDFLMILAWLSPFKDCSDLFNVGTAFQTVDQHQHSAESSLSLGVMLYIATS